MNLLPYLHTMPHNQTELDARVPRGTTIHVYFFPDLKGRARVQVFTGVPPSEANHRAAMNALNHGLLGLAVTAGLIFVLSRLRPACLLQGGAAPQDAMGVATPTQ
jgi:hypothetical protein